MLQFNYSEVRSLGLNFDNAFILFIAAKMLYMYCCRPDKTVDWELNRERCTVTMPLRAFEFTVRFYVCHLDYLYCAVEQILTLPF